MDLALTPAPLIPVQLLEMLKNSLPSEHSKRAYTAAVSEFFAWCCANSVGEFSKRTVQEYRAALLSRRLAASSVNVRLCAIRKLAAEMVDNAWLAPEVAEGIGRVKGIERTGTRCGNWLTLAQTEALLNAASPATLRGRRDRALLGILVGAGLRRAEAARLSFSQIQQREGRWVVADLLGKRGRIRTVPIPAWTAVLIEDWRSAAGLDGGHVFRPVNKAGAVIARSITAQTIFHIVRAYGRQIGVQIAPHDLRRTFARLAHKGHAALDQIQIALGHGSIATTERYLGLRLDLQDSACDHLGVRIAVGDERSAGCAA